MVERQQSYSVPKVLFIIFATLVVYFPAMKGTFLWDDNLLLLTHKQMQDPQWFVKIWLAPGASIQYYPVVYSVFWLEYQLWGYKVLGYHLVNIALHIFNALLVWRIMKSIKFTYPFAVAAIFALHPVHVETVAWISELKNLLSGFFYLLSLSFFLKFCENMDTRCPIQPRDLFLYGLSFLLYGLAILSKTITLSLPIALLIILYFRNCRITVRDVWLTTPFLLMGLILGWLAIRLEHIYMKGEWLQQITLPFLDRCLIAGKALWFYPATVIFPTNLSFVYPLWKIDPLDYVAYLYPVTAVLVLIVSFLLRNKWGEGIFSGLAFYVVTIFPAIGFFYHDTMQYTFVAGHYQYLASLGIIILLVSGVAWACDRVWKGSWQKSLVFAAIGVMLMSLSFQQAKNYRSIGVLFQDILSKNPDCWMVYHNRGTLLAQKKEFALALNDWEKAIALRPNYFLTYQNRALVYSELGDFSKALKDINRAIAWNPDSSKLYYDRGLILLKSGQGGSAQEDFGQAERLKLEEGLK